ncbi:c-1-tetrahydrofolate synthase cytoplasmic-related [Holotrichia oblita]|nr:c-1-tetrahydrofolate synthase cytoplasmic-related [Holotrichia oblita]
MTAQILDGKTYSGKIKDLIAKDIDTLKNKHGITPGLVVVIVGENEASKVYVASKHKTCTEMGMRSDVIRMPESTTKQELLDQIDKLNKDPEIHGILVQLPLPAHIKADEAEILNFINPDKDVDGFHPMNVGRLGIGEEHLVPCTPYGCVKMMELAGIEISGKKAVVIGRSNIVGKPAFNLLLSRNATVTVCHSRTKDLAAVCREADILVAAIGKTKFVTADMVKPGAVVIDVGINRVPGEKKIYGDVDFDAVKEVAGYITPVPGGVGMLTIAMLMYNTLKAACLQHKITL